MEALRAELRPSGIAVSIIAPGFVRTAINADNDFFMPFIMEPDEAAARIVRAIDAQAAEYRFPLMTSLAIRFLQVLPPSLYDRVMTWARSVGTEIRERTQHADQEATPASDSEA
jgi:short-subunit dehydrogenase